ncbi:MAG: SNF2-related protein, partial [Pirellula sp.]
MASKRDLLPFRDLLQKQIALALGGIIPSARDSALEEVVASFPKPKSKPVDLVKQWSDGIDETIDLVFDDEGFRTAPHYISLRITHLYADGEVHFSIVYSGETYHVFIRTKAGQPRVGCSCDASNGDGVCIHVEFAFDYLVDQFQFRHTPLCRRIAEARFDTGTPDHKKFHIDRSLIALEAISQFIKNSDEYKPADAELPKQDTKNATEDRLVWNLRGTINDLSISAHIQSKKKNGTGYTKGKRSSVQDVVVHYHHLLNDRDRKVLAIARKEYGDKELSIPALDALGLLVGAGNVCHDGEQIVVEQTGFYLGIAESSKGLHFAIGAENDLYREVVCFPSSNYAVTIDNKEKRVLLLTYPDGTRDGIGALLRLPPIEVKYAKEFIEKAIELQKRFPIKLPMDIAGAYHDDPGKLVIMLRSRPDGRLDYGLRIKTQTGLISLPGAPPAVVRGTHDGNQVQWIRRGASEIKNAAQLATTLGVNANTSNDFTGTIEDFDQGIRFLELLEKTKESLEVLWNKDSEKPIRMLGSVSAKNLRVEITSKRNWFGITGECKMGDTTLSLESLLENLGGTANPAMGDYVQVGDGQWARIEQSLREKLEHLRGASHLDRKNLMMDATAAMAIRSLASEDVEVKAAKSWQQCMMRLARADSLDPVLPTGLHAELRDYQVEGFRWLRRLAEWGVGGILADDMGLGKTLQTLAVLLDRASEGPTLVIAPTSVGFNWVRETQRFAPDLTPILYRESDRQELLTNLKSGDVVVSSYALALRDGSELAKIEWGTLVMDEAQAIKNSRSKTSQAVSNFNAKWSIALTGTPMENHLGELWSLFSVV